MCYILNCISGIIRPPSLCRYQEDPVSLSFGRLEKTTTSSPHHVAQHRPTGSETTPPYAPQSSRFGSEPPSVEDDVDIWCYAIFELHARNDDDLYAGQSERWCWGRGSPREAFKNRVFIWVFNRCLFGYVNLWYWQNSRHFCSSLWTVWRTVWWMFFPMVTWLW